MPCFIAARFCSINKYCICDKMGIPVEGGKKPEIPVRKRSEGVDDDTQHGGFHAVYLLPFRVDF